MVVDIEVEVGGVEGGGLGVGSGWRTGFDSGAESMVGVWGFSDVFIFVLISWGPTCLARSTNSHNVMLCGHKEHSAASVLLS